MRMAGMRSLYFLLELELRSWFFHVCYLFLLMRASQSDIQGGASTEGNLVGKIHSADGTP